MDKFPQQPPIPNQEEEKNKTETITSEQLIQFAKERPPQDPEVREMLARWIEQTRFPSAEKEKEFESVDLLEIDVMHTAMKYRLGFLSKEECLTELEETRYVVLQDPNGKDLHQRLSDLMYAIEDGTFE